MEFLVTAYENEKKRMMPNEYQKLAMRTCSIPYDQKKDMLMHAVLGLTSEAGEVSGLFQKKYQGHKLDPEHLEKELGDCLWMIAEACTALGWNMETVMQTNIEKLRARYPDGSVISGKIESWKDYDDGDQIQVKIDGTTYLVHSVNIVLIKE